MSLFSDLRFLILRCLSVFFDITISDFTISDFTFLISRFLILRFLISTLFHVVSSVQGARGRQPPQAASRPPT